MLLLSQLVSTMAPSFHMTIKGYDKKQNKYWTHWTGCKWQFVLGRDIEDCEVICVVQDWANDTCIIEVDVEYDNYGGLPIWH